jgi:hypothetical protein
MDMNHASGNCVNLSSRHASITTVMIMNLNCKIIVAIDTRKGRKSSKPRQAEVFMVNKILEDTSKLSVSSLFNAYS